MNRAPLAALVCIILAPAAIAQVVLHVNAAQTFGGNTGSCWNDAFRGPDALQRALEAAAPSAAAGQTVRLWVAAGSYAPTARTNPGDAASVTFQLRSGVELYGGFAGTETSLAQRNPQSNPTVLSGVLSTNAYDRASHVVTLSGVDNTCILDGFTITGGAQYGYTGTALGGAGLFGLGGSPVVRNCRIAGNTSYQGGGGGYFTDGSPRFEDCTFQGNSAGGSWPRGGALLGTADFQAVRCVFSGNSASYGDGGALEGNGTFTDCLFTGNSAEGGGAITGAGTFIRCAFSANHAEAYTAISGAATLVDCTFTADTVSGIASAVRCSFTGGSNYGAVSGGSFTDCSFVHCSGGYSPPVSGESFLRCRFIDNGIPWWSSAIVRASATNCLFLNNHAPILVGAATITNCTFLGNSGSNGILVLLTSLGNSAAVSNCIFWGNTTQSPVLNPQTGHLAVNYCCVQPFSGSLGGTGNFALDPHLDQDGRPIAGSPCIDAGDSNALPYGTTADLFGAPRIQDDSATPNTGPLAPVDIGAVEFQGVPTCYANCDGSSRPPILNVADFTCFINAYAAASPYANCDGSTTPPVLNILDFLCFLQRFAAGCP